MISEYKTEYWRGDNWYGDHLVWAEESPFPDSQEDPRVQFIIRGIKATVLEYMPKPNRIENETIVMRPPFKDGNLGIKGSIGWKAQLFWEQV